MSQNKVRVNQNRLGRRNLASHPKSCERDAAVCVEAMDYFWLRAQTRFDSRGCANVHCFAAADKEQYGKARGLASVPDPGWRPGWRPWVETLESCTSTFISINHDSHLMHLSQSRCVCVVMFSNVESAHGGASVLLTRTLF